MAHTSIEWVKNPDNQGQGITVNSKTGCLNGCEYCYARKLANRRLKARYLANTNITPIKIIEQSDYQESYMQAEDARIAAKEDPFYPRWWPQRLEQIKRMKKPTGIFLDDMSDWMADYWPAEWTEMELQVMRDCPHYRFYTLTKQPQNLIKWSPFPDNCWVGVTATGLPEFAAACLDLGDIRAAVKYISFEPLLSWGDYPADDWAIRQWAKALTLYGVNWLIIGACTGTLEDIKKVNYQHKDTDGLMPMPWGKKWTLQPHAGWVHEIVQAADKAGVKVFLKDNLKPLLFMDALSGQAALEAGLLNWEGQLRQELPRG